ncbi:hypothetical protein [Lacinutrix jangbogonensis]|uniref:hypothetical protein n=1 Tax=Lacinutrix jangbogonensis TaxID=1469557 RepID=UPI00053D0A8B|nr:hypothetical protein [Lacinutrix jangbogonensis]
MAILNFKGFLPIEEKPKEFLKFREEVSELLNSLDGELTFSYVEKYKQFDITENTTNKTYIEIRQILGEISKHLI